MRAAPWWAVLWTLKEFLPCRSRGVGPQSRIHVPHAEGDLRATGRHPPDDQPAHRSGDGHGSPRPLPLEREEVAGLRRVTIVASGASRHAGLCGKLMIEELAGIPVEVEHASEYGYRKPTNGKGSLVIAITQSGETADTTAAQRIAKENGMKTLSISNVVDSTISRRGRRQLLHPRRQGSRIPGDQELHHATHRALHAGAVSCRPERDTLGGRESRPA